MPTAVRKSFSDNDRMSTPSILIEPRWTSWKRVSKRTIVDFPEPVAPTKATALPGATLKLKPSIMGALSP